MWVCMCPSACGDGQKFKHGFNGGHGFGFSLIFLGGCKWVLDYLGDFLGFASAGALPFLAEF